MTGFWHFSRGLAFTSQGRLDRADKELKALQDDAALLPQTVELNGALGLADSGERLWTLSNSGLLKIAVRDSHRQTGRGARSTRSGDAVAA